MEAQDDRDRPVRHLRFSKKDDEHEKATLERPERWTTRRTSVGGSSEALGSKRRRMQSLKKQGSLFATADEDIVEEKRKRIHYIVYKLEQWLSNRNAQYLTLVLVGLTLILMGGLLWMAVQDPPKDDDDFPHGPFFEGIWVAWTFMADPGTHADVVTPIHRVVGSAIAVAGIIFFAALLGVVVDAIRNKMDLMRQGRSRVVESNHSLILGWTEKSILLIEELCVANQSEGGGTIVVMAKHPKQDMEQELRVHLPKKHLLGTKVVFRQGSPLLTHDLIKVGAHRARSIIILSDDNEPNQADAETLRTILVLRTLPYGLKGFIVAEVRDISNEPLLKMVGGSVTETVPSHDILGRLMLMAGRSPGLAKVYESLLGFQGDEFYIWEWPELQGLKFSELICRFPDAIPIGLKHASGTILMNPPCDHVVKKGDKLIVIAEDDDTYQPEHPDNAIEGDGPPYEEQPPTPETILVAGWRRDISDIFVYLDNLVVKGTELHMMTHCVSLEERSARLEDEGLDVNLLENIKIIHHFGNTTVRRKIEALKLESFTSCMIFADQAFEVDTMHADSHSLATLLLIRDAQMLQYEHRIGTINAEELVVKCPIVCEILDPRTQKTISGSIDVQHSSEFCHSNLMIAQIMAMVSENRSVKALLDEMLGYKGCSVAVFAAQRFAHPFEKASFWTLSLRASRVNMVLVGYALKGSIEKPTINPRDKKTPRAWDGYDLVALSPAKHKKLRTRASIGHRYKKAGTNFGIFREESESESSSGRGESNKLQEDMRRESVFSDNGFADEASPASMEEAPRPAKVQRASTLDHPPSTTSELDPLETKVLQLVESIASLDESERRRLGTVLDNVKELAGSLSASGSSSSKKKLQQIAARGTGAQDPSLGGGGAEWWRRTPWLFGGQLGQCVSDADASAIEHCEPMRE